MLRIFLTFGTLGAFTGVGIAWSVLRVEYPTFLMTNPTDFVAIHRLQERRIPEAAPILLMELASTAALLWFAPAGQRIWVALAMLALLAALVWGIGVQIPTHRILDKGGLRSGAPSKDGAQRMGAVPCGQRPCPRVLRPIV
jgi:hypothetical protein